MSRCSILFVFVLKICVCYLKNVVYVLKIVACDLKICVCLLIFFACLLKICVHLAGPKQAARRTRTGKPGLKIHVGAG